MWSRTTSGNPTTPSWCAPSGTSTRSPRSGSATRPAPCSRPCSAAATGTASWPSTSIPAPGSSGGTSCRRTAWSGSSGRRSGCPCGGIRRFDPHPLTPSPLRGEGGRMGSPKQNEEHLRAGIGSLWRAEPPYSHRVRLRRRAPSRLKVQRARHLRGDATLAEKQAWDILRGRRLFGLKFRRQHPIGGVIVGLFLAVVGLVPPPGGSRQAVHSQGEYEAAPRPRLGSK